MNTSSMLHSENFRIGKRSFYFDLNQSTNKQQYLTITQLRKNQREEFERQRILLNEREIRAFASAFVQCLMLFDQQTKQKTAAPSIEELRLQYPNAYRPWSKEDDLALEIYVGEELNLKELSSFFQRKESAIRARIKSLGLDNQTAA
ncbi:MAG: DUF3276 family protein [Bacteroidota bacterium]